MAANSKVTRRAWESGMAIAVVDLGLHSTTLFIDARRFLLHTLLNGRALGWIGLHFGGYLKIRGKQ